MNHFKKLFILAVMLFILSPLSVFSATSGRVLDSATLKPIQGATVVVNGEPLTTDGNGLFQSRATANRVMVKAPGYLRADKPVAAAPVEVRLTPFTPKALYLTVYGAGDRKIREAAVKLIEQTELNSLVIDVKGDRGFIPYKSGVSLAARVGGQKIITIRDPKALLSSLKEKGIYTIARIVTFKDNGLAQEFPRLAVKKGGAVWRDRERLAWVDPTQRDVWEYNIRIAEEAAQLGFDEIQFDYVRFPDAKRVTFSQPNTQENRVKAIAGFLREAKRRLTPYNVYVSADVFGYACWNLTDTDIGQRLEDIAPQVDYIAPMLYPSGFQFGIPGYRNPVANSREIVYLSLKNGQKRTNISSLRFRPWLQSFRDYAFDRRHFTGKEIREQIDASEKFGSHGWMLWNPRNSYSSAGLRPERSAPITGTMNKPVAGSTNITTKDKRL